MGEFIFFCIPVYFTDAVINIEKTGGQEVHNVRHRRKEKYLYYGLAILVTLFIIVGLVSALKGTDIRKGTGTPGKEKKSEESKGGRSEEKTAIDNPNIRVLIMDNGYSNIVHPAVTVSSDKGMTLTCGEEKEDWDKPDSLTIAPDDARFQKGTIRIQAKEGKVTLSSIKRGYGTPSYSGVIELRTTAEGIVIINELPVETYLCGVVPSEMPASYELEALKVQAVCARSYAYRQMADYGYPEYEAHVNDSTDYQVYGNSKEQESTSKAVAETAGQVVRYQGEVVTTYYYSTSCGKTTSMEAWGTAPNDSNGYLQSVNVSDGKADYEKGLPWYRWEASVPIQTLSDLVGLNTGTDVGTLSSVEVTKKGPGDVALQIKATGSSGSVTVETENKIRRALGGKGYQITKQDGTVIDSSALLPSAFFTIEKTSDAFVIKGGGYGHGIGMSQNGANEMAKQGKDYKEILTLFFHDVTIE